MTCVDHVLDSLEIGGAERLVIALARHQRRAGARVRVHALYALGPLAEQLRDHGIEVVDHQAPSGVLRASRKLLAHFRRSRPDVVHCHNAAATIAGATAASLARVPVAIATRHGWGRTEGAWRRELKSWLAARACARVVAVCEAARRALIAGPLADAKKTVTILNGAEAQQRGRTAVACDDRCVIVCVARLSWVKNHDTLLKALALARVQQPELVLHLVGDGERRGALEALAAALGISEAVTFLGEREDVGDCLGDGHAFALSSVTEGLPVALLEALAAGLTPIVSDVGGMPEVVQRAGVGSVVPAGDPGALAAALVRHARSRDRWPAWGETARGAFARHFTIERMCADYDALLSQCVAAAASR